MAKNYLYMACRDDAGLARHDYREWQELSADGVEIPPPTLFTKLIYPLQFVKYNFVPEILRYVWYHVWIRLVAAYGPYHKKLVLEGLSLLLLPYLPHGMLSCELGASQSVSFALQSGRLETLELPANLYST